jgi:hypothetical protein
MTMSPAWRSYGRQEGRMTSVAHLAQMPERPLQLAHRLGRPLVGDQIGAHDNRPAGVDLEVVAVGVLDERLLDRHRAVVGDARKDLADRLDRLRVGLGRDLQPAPRLSHHPPLMG